MDLLKQINQTLIGTCPAIIFAYWIRYNGVKAFLSYLCTYLNTPPPAHTSANSIRYSKKEFTLCKAGLHSFRGARLAYARLAAHDYKPHLDIALPSKHLSACWWGLMVWGLGTLLLECRCPQSGAGFVGGDLCSPMEPGPWKGSHSWFWALLWPCWNSEFCSKRLCILVWYWALQIW